MFADLDRIEWEGLKDAYGPGVDVPHQLRALLSDDLEVARDGLFALNAGIFHQGSYYSATAPAVPFLVEVVERVDSHIATEVALFLADMAAVHRHAEVGFDPWVFRSMPGEPTYPEAAATVDAIMACVRRLALRAADASPGVRAAVAYLVSGLDRDAGDALEARLALETDPAVRATLVLGLAALGRSTEPAPTSALERECAAAARALRGSANEGDIALLSALAARPSEPRTAFPFYAGDFAALACTALRGHATAQRSEVAGALRDALDVRLARGERIMNPPPPPTRRLSDLEPASPPEPWDPMFDAGLRALGAELARIAFGERARDPRLLERSELDEAQRAALALTAEHGIPVPVRGAPWITAASMQRFLSGGGALDRELTIDGVTAPLFVHLYAESAFDADLAQVERVFTALAPSERLEVLRDVLSEGYGVGGGWLLDGAPLTRAIELVEADLETLAPALEAWAEALAPTGGTSAPEARLVLLTFERARRAPPPAWDRLVARSLASEPQQRGAWLEAFEPARRAWIATWLGNPWVLSHLEAWCTPQDIETALLAHLEDSECGWLIHDAERVLARVEDLAGLEAARARASGERRRVLDRVIREKTREGFFTLRLSKRRDALGAELRDRGGAVVCKARLPRAPRTPDLAPFVAALPDPKAAVILLEGSASSTIRYAVMRHLSDLGVGQSRDGGSSLERGRN